MMRVKVGDYVKFIDSDIAGFCVEVKDNATLLIKNSDGLTIPVTESQVVVSEFERDLSEAAVGGARVKNRARSRTQQKSVRQDKSIGKANINTGSKQKAGSIQVAEIDLHTSIKPDIGTGPLPSDILSIQLDRFTSALRKAVAEKKSELISIHGEGSGRLRSEIRRISRELYPKFEVMDAPYHKYGNGATRIILKP